jgi:hypothetical protein
VVRKTPSIKLGAYYCFFVALINISFFYHVVKISGSAAGPKRPHYNAGSKIKSKWIYHFVPPD